jgi:hypothetical protein
LKDAFDVVKEAYPAGCLDWLRENNPDRIDELKATVQEAKKAFVAQDAPALDAALTTYRNMHLEAFSAYRHESEHDQIGPL